MESTGAVAACDGEHAAAGPGLTRRILDAVTAAGRHGISRIELREQLGVPPDSDRFRSALGHMVNRGQVVRRGAARRSLYYISDAVADSATRVPTAQERPSAVVAPLPPRRPGWESIHRTVSQPPARVPAPSGGVVWPAHVQVQHCPSPPAHSRYHVPPDTVGPFMAEWVQLRARGARHA